MVPAAPTALQRRASKHETANKGCVVPLDAIRQLPGRIESAPRAEVTDAPDNTAEMNVTARAA